MRTKLSHEQRLESFWNRVLFTTDCWEWLGGKNPKGYGLFWTGKKMIPAHRFILKLFGKELDSNLNIDHLCRNRSCVNPEHLEEVTVKENVLRGIGITALNAIKTHCLNGHVLDDENTYYQKNQRKCKKCRLSNHRKWYQKNQDRERERNRINREKKNGNI